jgi:hypothetical protein
MDVSDDILSRSSGRWVSFWHRPKLTTNILHINVIASRGGNRCIRGLRNGGRRGLGSLGWRFLDSRLLFFKQKGISNEIDNNEEKRQKQGYLDFGRLIVAVFSNGVSSSALQ